MKIRLIGGIVFLASAAIISAQIRVSVAERLQEETRKSPMLMGEYFKLQDSISKSKKDNPKNFIIESSKQIIAKIGYEDSPEIHPIFLLDEEYNEVLLISIIASDRGFQLPERDINRLRSKSQEIHIKCKTENEREFNSALLSSILGIQNEALQIKNNSDEAPEPTPRTPFTNTPDIGSLTKLQHELITNPDSTGEIFEDAKQRWRPDKTGTLVPPTSLGICKLTIDNGTASAAIVKMVSNSTLKKYASYYILKGESITIPDVKDDSYSILFCFGGEMIRGKDSFENPKSSKLFSQPLRFQTTVTRNEEGTNTSYSVLKLTLYEVSGGNAKTEAVSQDVFDKY